MKKIETVKMLFSAYIGLIILFNIITLPTIALPGGQLLISILFILLIMYLIVNVKRKRKIVWWGFLILSILGVLRPILEYIFSRVVPFAAQNFFPPFTPLFSIIGFLLMSGALIFILDFKTKKEFSNP